MIETIRAFGVLVELKGLAIVSTSRRKRRHPGKGSQKKSRSLNLTETPNALSFR
jgi:hypothetical protein